MYAHQIIEDNRKLQKSKEMKEFDETFLQNSRMFTNFIHLSTQFHLGNIDSAESFTKEKDDMSYMQGIEEFLRLPYPVTYIDFPVDNDNQYGKVLGMKKSALICIQNKEFNVYTDRDNSFPDACLVQAFNYNSDLKLWLLNPFRQIIDLQRGSRSTMHPYQNYGKGFKFTDEQETVFKTEDAFGMMVLNFFLMLLHCKNIQAVDNNPSKVINSQRRQQHKIPFFTYKTLHIIPVGSSKNKKDYVKHGDHNRVHMCRGHYRRYTEEAPLFGKYVGMYWIPNHARGKNKDGIVVKDYEMNPEPEN